MHQKYAKTLKQKVEIYANFPTEKFLSKVTIRVRGTGRPTWDGGGRRTGKIFKTRTEVGQVRPASPGND